MVSQVGNHRIIGYQMRFSEAKPKILTQLGDLTALQISQLVSESLIDKGISPRRDDFVLSSPEFDFYIEYKSKSTTETIGAAIRALKSYSNPIDPPNLPLIVVPYMGEVGKGMCKQAHISWMDLSGNALIHAEGLHVNVSGYPNQFADRGRPKNIFAPSAARITRLLLQEPAIRWNSQTLMDRTGLSKGYVSKILTRLERQTSLSVSGTGQLARQIRKCFWRHGQNRIHSKIISLKKAILRRDHQVTC